MIDIHTHILPNIDDGSDSLELSIEMLKKEKEIGVSTVVLTPHLTYDDKCLPKEEIEKMFEKFKEQAKALDINLLLGSEIFYNHETLEAVKKGLLPTMNGTKYVLLEFSLLYEQFDIEEIAYNFIINGYKPIIAHPERYSYIDFEKIKKIKSDGALIQVNSSSLLGDFGKETKKASYKMLKNGLVDFVASDCHSMGVRCPNIDLCKKKFGKYYPEDNDEFLK